MSKGGLRFLAAVLTTGIAVTPFLGLDNLPRDLQARIDAERTAWTAARTQFRDARADVEGDLRADPALFRARAMITAFPERFRKAGVTLGAAERDESSLAKLREANRRQDRSEAERLLKQAQAQRTAALAEATGMQAEANRWVEMKRNLPQQLQRMEQDYQALRGVDVSTIENVVRKAQADWPEKKADLEARIESLRGLPAQAGKIWQESEPLRRQAAAGDYEKLDYAALLTAAETLHTARTSLPSRSQELVSLTGQLYEAWDKVLVDLEVRRGGNARDYHEKIRTVRTRFADPAAKQGQVTSDEKWVEVSRADFQAAEKNLGMAIEHKSAGKYDFEAERTAQPAGFAYMAPPSQERNQYGYWERRNGQSFWVWYGQYALLRDLLFNRDYRPLDTREYEGYRSSRSRGQTYYGRDETAGAPKYGSSGTATQSRYSGSTYARGGGFRDSEYASRGGGYRGSEYQTRGYRRDPDDADVPRRFGTRPYDSGRSAWTRSSPSPSRGWSSGRSSGAGRSFGGGGGRSFGGGGGRSFGGGGGRRR